MSVLCRKLLCFLVQDTCCLMSHFHLFVHAVTNIFIQGESDSKSYDHPFVRELLDYIEIALTYLLGKMQENLSVNLGKINRGRLRAKEHNFKKENMLHTFCGKLVLNWYFSLPLFICTMSMIMFILQSVVIILFIKFAGMNIKF